MCLHLAASLCQNSATNNQRNAFTPTNVMQSERLAVDFHHLSRIEIDSADFEGLSTAPSFQVLKQSGGNFVDTTNNSIPHTTPIEACCGGEEDRTHCVRLSLPNFMSETELRAAEKVFTKLNVSNVGGSEQVEHREVSITELKQKLPEHSARLQKSLHMKFHGEFKLEDWYLLLLQPRVQLLHLS